MLGIKISTVASFSGLDDVFFSLLFLLSFSNDFSWGEFESESLSLSKNPSNGVDDGVADESFGAAGGSGRTDDIG